MAKHLIRTEYYDHNGDVIQSFTAKGPNSACNRAHNNLFMNTYGARSAQVFHIETAQLYGHFIRQMNNKILSEYHYDPLTDKDPIRHAMAALFNKNEMTAINAVLRFKG